LRSTAADPQVVKPDEACAMKVRGDRVTVVSARRPNAIASLILPTFRDAVPFCILSGFQAKTDSPWP
jgi:hypothetical protein